MSVSWRSCPRCGGRVGLRQRLSSSPIRPMVCRGCGAAITVKSGWGSNFAFAFGSEAALYGGLIAAFFLWSWWPLVAGLSTAFGLTYVQQIVSPIVLVTPEELQRNRRLAMMVAAVLAIVIVIAGMTDR